MAKAKSMRGKLPQKIAEGGSWARPTGLTLAIVLWTVSGVASMLVTPLLTCTAGSWVISMVKVLLSRVRGVDEEATAGVLMLGLMFCMLLQVGLLGPARIFSGLVMIPEVKWPRSLLALMALASAAASVLLLDVVGLAASLGLAAAVFLPASSRWLAGGTKHLEDGQG